MTETPGGEHGVAIAGDPAADCVKAAPARRRPALSPSRAGDFKQCPLLYRFRAIDRLPEVPTRAQVRGTLVHAVLERLFDLPAAERSPAAARALLEPAWDRLCLENPELLPALFTGPDDPELTEWLTSAGELLDAYFGLEDPRGLEPAARELLVETELDSGLLLRGYIDRVDIAPTGEIRVVDYKGLALDTPLPTPTGWTTMGDVAVGDSLIGADGWPCRVIGKSEVHHRPCYELRLTDGSRVVADNVHLWSVYIPSKPGDRVPATSRQHRGTPPAHGGRTHRRGEVVARSPSSSPRHPWSSSRSILPDPALAPRRLVGDGATRGWH